MYQKMGFLPEGLLNYLALLGWSPGNDVEFFSLADMARDFDISRVNASPARFDLKKAIALNADWVRAVKPQELANRIKPYLVEAGVLPAEPTPEQLQILVAATPLVSERMEVLSQAAGMLGFLFAGKNLIIEEDAAKILAEPDAAVVRAAAVSVLESCEPWLTPSIKDVLQKRLVDEMGLKPREAFGVLRAAITGRKVSPPLFESMELLGRTQTLSRLR
jgi:glutamyl-tRNA synthetase